MHYILSLFPNFGTSFSALWYVFARGGWFVFVMLIIYILYKLYRIEIIVQFMGEQEWTYLLVKVPRENTTSLLATEQIFTQLHALHSALSWAEVHVEGKVQLWYSFEIVSMGGKLSLVMRLPKKMRDNVEAAWYAHYPEVELTEIADYLENAEYHSNGENDFEIFGFELKLIDSQAIPIKTYKDFQDNVAEIKSIDPLAPIFESMAKMEPWEFFGVQIIAEPLGDQEWKGESDAKAKELLGEKPKEGKPGWFGLIGKGLQMYNPINLLHESEEKKEEKNEKNNLLNMTELEKDRVNLVQRKAGKPGYRTKVRLLYMAPKDKNDGGKKAILIGAFRTLGSAQTNGFKPDTKETWTDLKYRFSPTLEKPYLEYETRRRKHHIWEAYKGRSNYIGLSSFVLNVEELATLFHPPLTESAPSAQIEKVESKKSQAPQNLPME